MLSNAMTLCETRPNYEHTSELMEFTSGVSMARQKELFIIPGQTMHTKRPTFRLFSLGLLLSMVILLSFLHCIEAVKVDLELQELRIGM